MKRVASGSHKGRWFVPPLILLLLLLLVFNFSEGKREEENTIVYEGESGVEMGEVEMSLMLVGELFQIQPQRL